MEQMFTKTQINFLKVKSLEHTRRRPSHATNDLFGLGLSTAYPYPALTQPTLSLRRVNAGMNMAEIIIVMFLKTWLFSRLE